MTETFSLLANKALWYADDEARKTGCTAVSPEHILIGILFEPDFPACRLVKQLGADPTEIRKTVSSQLGKATLQTTNELGLTPQTNQVFQTAYNLANTMDSEYVHQEHLLLGLIQQGDGYIARVMSDFKLDFDVAHGIVVDLYSSGSPPARVHLSLNCNVDTTWSVDYAMEKALAFVGSHEGERTEILPSHIALALSLSPPHPLRSVLQSSEVDPKKLATKFLDLCDQSAATPGKQVTYQVVTQIVKSAAKYADPVDSIALFLAACEADRHVRGEVEEATGIPFDDFFNKVYEFRKTQDS